MHTARELVPTASAKVLNRKKRGAFYSSSTNINPLPSALRSFFQPSFGSPSLGCCTDTLQGLLTQDGFSMFASHIYKNSRLDKPPSVRIVKLLLVFLSSSILLLTKWLQWKTLSCAKMKLSLLEISHYIWTLNATEIDTNQFVSRKASWDCLQK